MRFASCYYLVSVVFVDTVKAVSQCSHLVSGEKHCLKINASVPNITSFRHPGILLTSEQILNLRENVKSGQEPWAQTYRNLQGNTRASSNYTLRGPQPVIGRESGNSTYDAATVDWDNDCNAAYLNALMYCITQEDSHAQKVAEIVDGWSSSLTDVVNNDNLATALAGRQLVNAAEMVRYARGSWPTGPKAFQGAQQMVSSVLVPHKDALANPPSQPVPGGNQALLGHLVGMEFAIFTDNITGYNAELEILRQPKTTCVGTEGSGIQALLQPKIGQCAEAGRDQGHSADEVGWVEESAHIASNQGDDSLFNLRGLDEHGSPLLLLAVEYYFKYNTGSNVPFDDTWHPCCCGSINYTVISNGSRGLTYPFGEMSYRYYHGLRNYDMPYTEDWLLAKRPLQNNSNYNDFLSWPTLIWAEGEI